MRCSSSFTPLYDPQLITFTFSRKDRHNHTSFSLIRSAQSHQLSTRPIGTITPAFQLSDRHDHTSFPLIRHSSTVQYALTLVHRHFNPNLASCNHHLHTSDDPFAFPDFTFCISSKISFRVTFQLVLLLHQFPPCGPIRSLYSWSFYALVGWVMHLTGFLHLFVADRCRGRAIYPSW